MWRHARIRDKLAVALVAVALAALGAVSWIGHRSGEQSLRRAAFSHLTAVRSAKTQQIESYFADLRNEVAMVAQARQVLAAMRDFSASVERMETRARRHPAPPPPASLLEYYQRVFHPKLVALSPIELPLEVVLPGDAVAMELQRLYVSDNPHPVGEKDALDAAGEDGAYRRAHARYHPQFREVRRRFGYYDLFLVDEADSRIVYSVSKETDFGTRLDTGPHRYTGLAAAVAAARSRNGVVLADFEFYSPSYGAPAAFMAAPVVEGGERLGVLAVQIPVDRIDAVMTGNRGWEAHGLGRSGETYIVGSDLLMRSNSRFALEDLDGFIVALAGYAVPESVRSRVEHFGTTILLQTVDTPAVAEALAGRSDTAVIDDYRGIEVLSSYVPLDIEDVSWVMLSEIDAEEAFAPVRRFARQVTVAAIGVGILVVTLSIVLARTLLRPIETLSDAARRLAAGDLDARADVHGEDELGGLAHTFNDMAASIREKTGTILRQNRENEALLLSILPRPIADRLKKGEDHIADAFSDVSVLFADLVGFTALSRTLEPSKLVVLLDELFSEFDRLAHENGIEKIKTIGDAYMAVCGLPRPHPNHAHALAEMALGMIDAVGRFNDDHKTDLSLRIGINSGPVVAGVIGRTKFIYDLWGDTVNVASRMESHGVANEIQVTQETRRLLADDYVFEGRGEIAIKGRGSLETYFLRGRRTG